MPSYLPSNVSKFENLFYGSQFLGLYYVMTGNAAPYFRKSQ
jgi:hypothetical protein